MLEIEDPWIWSAYLLTLLSAIGCVVYGLVFWNQRDGESPEDAAWEKEEEEVEEAL